MPSFPSPDLAKYFQTRMASSMQFFGQSVTYKKYISASGGNPEFGIGDTGLYQLRPGTWTLRPLNIQEVQAMGGQAVQGAMEFTTQDAVGQRDEVVYQNTAYRIVSVPTVEQIGINIYYRGIMAISQVTGVY